MSTEDLTRNARENTGRSENKKIKNNKIRVFGINLFIDGGFDIIFMILVFALLTTGLIMLFSASYITAKYSPETSGNAFYYIIRQGVFAVVGVCIMFFVSKINPEIFKKFVWAIAAISIILLIVVLFYHTEVNQANTIKRWMKLPGFTIQPSDVAKIGMIITLAYTLEKYKKQLEKKWWLPLVFVGGVAGVCGLVFLESHLSGTILMFAIGIGMLFLGGIDRRWFILGIGAAVVLFALFWMFKEKILSPYQIERITSFSAKDYYDKDTRWQTNQSLFALGSGGIFGLGLGNSRQKFMYLPEPQNDFIFAIVGEELGFIRCVVILLLFAALVTRGFIIAARARSAYERLLVLGICLQLGIQTVLNILVVTDMMPNTGISLPFFSYGGTALLIQLFEMGLVLAVSRPGERRPH
ncbi:MAG: putative lipid II flippase FtsW [Clostridia bacterium]|nr:putative lipid II flippase FtsW [Clostridia bacterium]